MKFEELVKLPLKVLLDTTVIQNILTFGEYIFENWLSPELEAKLHALPETLQMDIHALRNIIEPRTRTPVIPIISDLSLHELSLTGDPEKCARLLQWGFDLLEYSDRMRESNRSSLTSEQTVLSDFLPGRIDRLLIGECKWIGCQALITMDYRSILKFRRELLQNDRVTVLSPSEWWKLLEPWFPLWV
jgi:hypothetical protein